MIKWLQIKSQVSMLWLTIGTKGLLLSCPLEVHHELRSNSAKMLEMNYAFVAKIFKNS